MQEYVPVLLAISLSFFYLATQSIGKRIRDYHPYFISLGSSMFIAVLFVEIFPVLLSTGVPRIGQWMFVSILAGFVAYHIVEKFTYKHATTKKELRKELNHVHTAGLFLDSFIHGVLLVFIFQILSNQFLIYLIFIPMLMGTLSQSITFSHIDEKFKYSHGEGLLLGIAPVLGGVLAFLSDLSQVPFFYIMSFLIGVLLYFVVRDEIPSGKKGNPITFLAGVIVVVIVSFIINGII